jgi:phosphoadenosine phosphosulfate reductase
MTTTELNLEDINSVLDTYVPPRIVDWAAKEFGEELVMSSSFGAESAVLIHLTTQVLPRIRIIMVDTGYLFPETHQFMESLRRRFDLNMWVYRTRNDPIRYLEIAGETDPHLRRDVERCCQVNKNEPFERAIKELAPAAWLRGIRRSQAETRSDRTVVEWSNRNNCYAISPLLPWSDQQIQDYMTANDLPYHPLYESGYKSIGCNPLSCTRPIVPGENPRAGRWSGTGKTECGLHLEVSSGSHI